MILLLIAENYKDAQYLLKFACEFFEKRGFKLNPSKCKSLSLAVVPSKKKVYLKTTAKFHVNGEFSQI